MSDTARLDTYAAPGGSELIIARGPADGPQLLIVQPLFEEAGFTRSFVTDLSRVLATEGIGSWLFDLPGQGDSVAPLARVRLDDWRAAVVAAAAHVENASGMPRLATIRGGALLVPPARPVWRLAPCDGAAVLRPLRRAGTLGTSAGLGGWPIGVDLAADLDAAPLFADGARDVAWPGSTPPWRRAEPGRDDAAAAALAAHLTAWIASCAAR